MPLPDDLTTFTLTFGPYIDATGAPVLAGTTGTLKPDRKLVHVATGRQILESPIQVTIDAFGMALVGPLPHVDNDGIGGPFLYKMVWDLPPVAPSPGNLQFSVLESDGVEVDFDLLAPSETVPSVSVPSALSVGGYTGAVTADQLATALDTPGNRLSEDAQRAAFVPFWKATEVVTTGTVRVDSTGHLITANSNRTTRASYDATEQAAWTVVSGGGGTIADGSITLAKLAFDPATQAELDAVAAAKVSPTTAAGISAGMALVFGG